MGGVLKGRRPFLVAFEDLRALFGEEAFELLVLGEGKKGVLNSKIPWKYIQSYPCERVYKLLRLRLRLGEFAKKLF